MFDEYEHVKIKSKGVTGIIVDKSRRNGTLWYVIEGDEPGERTDAYGDLWPLFDCTEDDLLRIA